ncbi:hypothetical protein OEA41_000305 [Lepraria neglecta]|uniref:Uncharacterized protein n=1 Tax=Lepraria neglecta TaxID=209136 RepID=A0AAD9ZIC6_9LECA|nr:hypothetical protein OEA41_000305 [Lepraria neglecta]
MAILKYLVYPMALLGAGVGTEVWIYGRQLEAAEKRITKATQGQVKATVRSEVTKSMEQFEKGLLASVAKVVQEEVTPMEKRITKATQEQVKATVGSEVTKSMEQFEKGLLASVAKVVQEEVTPMKVTLQDVQGRVVYLDSASMTMTSMMLANCQKKK